MVAAGEITVYHAVPTRSCRVVWLLEELGVPYTVRAVDWPTELTTPEFLALQPMGTCAPIALLLLLMSGSLQLISCEAVALCLRVKVLAFHL